MRRANKIDLCTEGNKSAVLRVFESVFLALCLCVLAVRSTYLESPHGGMLSSDQLLTNEAFSALITSVLVLSFAGWLIAACVCRRFVYRFSGIEIGVVLFFAAGIAGVLAASNKRAAVTDMVTVLGAMLAAILLIQVLDGSARVRLVLFVVLALGVVTTAQCVEQFAAGNQNMIAYYEQDPEARLKEIGAEYGSFEHMMYEHRLYGKDIRGYLTTSNSTGSFLLLAAFAGWGLFADAIRNRSGSRSYAAIVCLDLAAIIVVVGLAITRSRGALAAGSFCGIAFVALLVLGRFLYRRKALLLGLFVAAVICGTAAIIWYGTTHGTLPGGASMLVRWQYWEGAARMYADHPVTGVGGGNFSSYYTHYKIAAAPETVSDPHNFILSLLSQYGPLGAVGFVGALAAVLLRGIFSKRRESELQACRQSGVRAWLTAAAVCCGLLIVRPVLLPTPASEQTAVVFSAAILLYVFPVCVFALAFWLLWVSEKGLPEEAVGAGEATQIAISCGVVAVAIHNLIDFAVFEPAVLTLLWMMVGCLFAIDSQRVKRRAILLAMPGAVRIITVLSVLVGAGAYVHFALAPVVKAGAKIQRGLNDAMLVHELFDEAAEDDPLAPEPFVLGGKAFLRHYEETGKDQKDLLTEAALRFGAAAARDEASFKNYERLSTLYEMMAESEPPKAQSELHLKAIERLQEAVKRYDGSGKLHLRLARLAEQEGNDKLALPHYRRAIQIEDAYRAQFVMMYPNREMFSRLGEKNYQLAKSRIAALGGQ